MISDRGAKVLYQGEPSTSLAAVYTVPAAKRAILTKLIATNVGGAASSGVSVHIDPDGTTYDDNNALWHELAVVKDGRESDEFRDGMTLEAGGSVGAQNHTANAVCLTVLGYEEDERAA